MQALNTTRTGCPEGKGQLWMHGLGPAGVYEKALTELTDLLLPVPS